MMRWQAIIVATTITLLTGPMQGKPTARHALLIGIDDYSASHLPKRHRAAAERDLPNLDGAVNDVELMRELLIALYGFHPADIVSLTNEEATRDAILSALRRRLLATTHKGDTVLFYYSGHGSQVRNSLSSEVDHLDESLVPADSRRGAPDIRDKELRTIFNAILDRGAHLTIVLDTCHSGSGARGLDGGLRYRGVKPDLRDVADRSTGPRPEERGALVLAAAQDFDLAFETLDEQKKIRGAFSWALARALRDAPAGESASDTFLRAQARLHAERPAQDPVLAGNDDARLRPFLGARSDRRGPRLRIAVQKAIGRGTYLLEGGWAGGVTVGSELRVVGHDAVRLEVTSLRGAAHSVAHLSGNGSLHSGTLLEIVTWAAPPSPPLRVWIPEGPQSAVAEAARLRSDAIRRGIRWIDDPTEQTPTHLLRWRDDVWEWVTNGKQERVVAPKLEGVPSGASLFVQLPATATLAQAIGSVDGIERAQGPQNADYVLAGRLAHKRIEYAWVRPSVTASDRRRSVLPLRTGWIPANEALTLRDQVIRLRVVKGWHELRSPEPSRYRLDLRRTRDGKLVDDGTLVGRERYQLVLRDRRQRAAEPIYPQYVYIFVIDGDGKSVLLFPSPGAGSVENLVPYTPTPGRPIARAPSEIPLVGARPFEIAEPYGVDTYFLLCTDEPLPHLGSLEWEGVRGGDIANASPLEKLLALTLAGTRGPNDTLRTPPDWSIDQAVFESIPPRSAAP